MKDFTTQEVVTIHTALAFLKIDVADKNSLNLKATPDDIQEIIWKVLKSI